MANLREKQGYLLGLGTNLGTVTFYHCLEDIENWIPARCPYRRFSPDRALPGILRETYSMSLNALDGVVARTRIDRPENAAIREFFTERLERHAGLRWFQVGEARSWVILASALYDEAINLMNYGVTIYSTREEIEAFKRVRGEE